MTVKLKKYLLFIGLVVMVIMLAAFTIASYFVISAKPRLEKIASNSLNMKVTCGGVHLSLLPFSIIAEEVKISNNGAQVALITSMRAHIDLRSLLDGRPLIPVLSMEKPDFTLTRFKDNTWNFETTKREKKEPRETASFLFPIVHIRDADLIIHVDEYPLEMQGVNMTIQNAVLKEDSAASQFSRLSLNGTLNSRELRNNQIIIRDLVCHLQGSAGNFIFDPVSFKAFGGTALGKVEADMDGGSPVFNMQLQLSGFRAEDFFTALTKKEILRGEMELALHLTAMGKKRQELLRSVTGRASMAGRNLTATSLDLDNLLERLMKGRQFDLADLGGLLILGPLGPALTKAMDFGLIVNADYSGYTRIRQLISFWQIKEGKAEARDVAVATEKHRIAIKGGIDIAAERFRNLQVAVVDAQGCALVRQQISGSFKKPQIKETNLIESAAAPLLNLFKETTQLITGEKCEIFYNGSVAFPGN